VTDRRTDGRTDRQTDRILITIPRLHYMQRGKKIEANVFVSEGTVRYVTVQSLNL